MMTGDGKEHVPKVMLGPQMVLPTRVMSGAASFHEC
jgi:hypothetical protein